MSEDNQDFTQLHKNIKAEIKKQMPFFATVADYEPLTDGELDTPAALLEVVELKPAGKKSGGRMAIKVEFLVHCILGAQTENIQLQVRNCATRMLMTVNDNRWSLGGMVGLPQELSAYPGIFKPDDDGFESWVVQWDQEIHLGDEWQLPDFLPPGVEVDAVLKKVERNNPD